MSSEQLSGRQREMLGLIQARGFQQIERLAEHYGLAPQTIRRDINALCALGFARRLHGGVDLPVETGNISLNARADLNGEAKRRIGRAIAAAIEPHSTVFLGIGSTMQFVAAALLGHEGLTIVTNNIPVALCFCEAPQIEVHLTGGVLRHDDRDVVGAEVMGFFGKFYARYAVVGAGALDPQNGLLDFSYREAQVTNAILHNSQEHFLAADVSKWSRHASVRVAPFQRISRFFTDRQPPDSQAEPALRGAGVELVLCDGERLPTPA